MLTNDAALWDVMDSYRVHGKAVAADTAGRTFDHDPKYLNMRIGMNSRLDTIQAAILIEKLAIFGEEIELRQAVADRYASGLSGSVIAVPKVIRGGQSTWAQYVIEHDNRDGLAAHLKANEIPSAVYYPVPMHQQAPYADFPVGPGGMSVSEAKAETVIALPMHPYLQPDVQDRVIEAIKAGPPGRGARGSPAAVAAGCSAAEPARWPGVAALGLEPPAELPWRRRGPAGSQTRSRGPAPCHRRP